MINKVNGPPKLALVRETKSTENDPGASSGSGVAYERQFDQKKDDEKDDDQDQKKPKLSIVSELEKSGMTEVVKDFLEHKNSEQAPPPSPGLTNKYQVDVSKTKGLLLNKKAE